MASKSTTQWNLKWTIVRADRDLEHVMLPLKTFRMRTINRKAPRSYQLVHEDPPPTQTCFAGAKLVHIGHEPPDLRKILGKSKAKLPAYDQNNKKIVTRYAKDSELISSYMAVNPQIERLEGVVTIPCHDPAVPLHKKALVGHEPFKVQTLLQFYHFPKAVEGGHSLLFVRAPVRPGCPMNGDGTAGGVGHN